MRSNANRMHSGSLAQAQSGVPLAWCAASKLKFKAAASGTARNMNTVAKLAAMAAGAKV